MMTCFASRPEFFVNRIASERSARKILAAPIRNLPLGCDLGRNEYDDEVSLIAITAMG
jgi:hypothetical protein